MSRPLTLPRCKKVGKEAALLCYFYSVTEEFKNEIFKKVKNISEKLGVLVRIGRSTRIYRDRMYFKKSCFTVNNETDKISVSVPKDMVFNKK